MEKIIKVEGMSCGHCEKRVENALKELNKVEIIEISADKNQVIINIDDNKDLEEVKEAIEDAGYEVI